MAHVKNRQIIDENCLINILLPSDVTNAVLGQKKKQTPQKRTQKTPPHNTKESTQPGTQRRFSSHKAPKNLLK